MGALLFGLVAGSGLTWVFMELRRDGYWREFNARRRGSNPPPPGRKPAVPEQPLAARLIRYQLGKDEQVRRAWLDPCLGEPWPEDCKPDRQADVVLDREASEAELVRRRRDRELYGWGPRQLPPPTLAPGMRREYLWSPTQMAECGGPCWEAQDPRRCVCGALWRDVPIRLDEGKTQRGNGNGGPNTPKSPSSRNLMVGD
jgi:hypothetical protein